jgi:hypothetical protein
MTLTSSWGVACAAASRAGADHLINKSVVCAALLIASFALSALASGCLHVKWWFLSDVVKGKVWRMYGPFTGLMCVGSVFGCLTWVSNLKFLAYYLPVVLSNTSFVNSTASSHDSSHLALVLDSAPAALRWHGVFFVT